MYGRSRQRALQPLSGAVSGITALGTGTDFKSVSCGQYPNSCSTVETFARFTKWLDNVEVVRLRILPFAAFYQFGEIPFL